MSKSYTTPITGSSVSGDLPGDLCLGGVSIRRLTGEELYKYLGVCDPRSSADGRSFQFIQHASQMRSDTILNEIQRLQMVRATHAFVSSLGKEEHQKRVKNILHTWRVLRMSRVACPITYNDATPGVTFQRPIECRLGSELVLDSNLVAEIIEPLKYIENIPNEDLDLIDLANETGVQALSVFFLVVIAERSIMRGDKNEISFKASLYGSRLLQEHYGIDPSKAYRTFRDSYEIRSALAHGRVVNREDVKDVISDLYRYVTKIRLLTMRYPECVSAGEKDRILFMEKQMSR